MTEKDCARLQAHISNIGRYRRLLETNLSEIERTFIRRRLSERTVTAEIARCIAGFSSRQSIFRLANEVLDHGDQLLVGPETLVGSGRSRQSEGREGSRRSNP